MDTNSELIGDKLFKMLIKAYAYRVLCGICFIYILVKTDNMLITVLANIFSVYLAYVTINDLVHKTISFEKTFLLFIRVEHQQLFGIISALIMLWQIFMFKTLNEYIVATFVVVMQFTFGSYMMKDILWVKDVIESQKE